METLKRSGQFERVRREGRTWASSLMVLNAAPNGQDTIRCGFIAGKKVGGAVGRNRARRLLREGMRAELSRVRNGYDLVWIARAPIAEAKQEAVSKEMEALLLRGKLLAPANETANETVKAQSRIIVNNSPAAPPTDNATSDAT